MYGFVDTTDSGSVRIRPSEAMQVNGEYLEDLVPGYRTLSVSGRELHTAEVDVLTKGMVHGGRFIRKRLSPRHLTVNYQLLARSNGAFREAFNQLNRALAVEEAVLVFEDEQDKHFIGTPGSAGEVPEGVNKIVSRFGIVCARPWKFGEEVVEGLSLINAGSGETPCFVRVRFREATRDFTIRHVQQDKETRIAWEFGENDVLEIDMGRRLVTINNNVRMTAFDFRTRMFNIQPGVNTFETSVASSWAEIRYRPRWL